MFPASLDPLDASVHASDHEKFVLGQFYDYGESYATHAVLLTGNSEYSYLHQFIKHIDKALWQYSYKQEMKDVEPTPCLLYNVCNASANSLADM